VVAHEMSHVRKLRHRFATLVGILVGMIALIADFFLRWSFSAAWGAAAAEATPAAMPGHLPDRRHRAAIVAPLAAYSVQFAISRPPARTCRRHRRGAHAHPLGLARALYVIAADPQPAAPCQSRHGAPLHRNPRKNKKDKAASSVFDTHPPNPEALDVLLAMAHAGPEALTAAAPPRAAEAAAPPPPLRFSATRRRYTGRTPRPTGRHHLRRRPDLRQRGPAGLTAGVPHDGQPAMSPVHAGRMAPADPHPSSAWHSGR